VDLSTLFESKLSSVELSNKLATLRRSIGCNMDDEQAKMLEDWFFSKQVELAKLYMVDQMLFLLLYAMCPDRWLTRASACFTIGIVRLDVLQPRHLDFLYLSVPERMRLASFIGEPSVGVFKAIETESLIDLFQECQTIPPSHKVHRGRRVLSTLQERCKWFAELVPSLCYVCYSIFSETNADSWWHIFCVLATYQCKV
jgi:hypothetical protein